MLKIGLDIDGVLGDFMESYIERFGLTSNEVITRNCERVLSKDREFWMNLTPINGLDFIPELYCTKRVNPKAWTKAWLQKHDYPDRPVYQMFYQGGNKASMIKGKVDIFIDDSPSNFIKMNESGVPCLLFNTDYNQEIGPIGRIYSLELSEIKQAYKEFVESNMYKIIRNLI
jgi:hypothetical protein